MKLKRILWSLLAGASITASMAGCIRAMYGVPEDISVDEASDSSDSEDQDQEEVSDIVSEDPAQEESTPAPMYGPVPDA